MDDLQPEQPDSARREQNNLLTSAEHYRAITRQWVICDHPLTIAPADLLCCP